MPRQQAKKDGEFRFAPGDRVEAFDRTGLRVQGTVESVAFKQRILWIHTSTGERKLLDPKEHTIELSGVALNGLAASLTPKGEVEEPAVVLT